jgi:phosphoribosylanthranilate isomerase
MTVSAKICGLSTPETLDAAIDGGAAMVGFVFYPRSPRAILPAALPALAARVPAGVPKVGLVVDAEDALIDAVVSAGIDIIQAHGDETAERVAAIRARAGRPVMKAVGIAGPDDVARAHAFEAAADLLLLDAKPPKNRADALPGGNGLAFDWQLIAGESWARPWLLAGGLDAGNVAEAVAMSGARMVDVSSGVEERPGVKSPERIRAFLEAVRRL